MVHGAGGKQRRDRQVRGADFTIRKDENVRAVLHRLLRAGTQRLQRRVHARRALGGGVTDTQDARAKLVLSEFVDAADLLHVGRRQHGLAYLQAQLRLDVVQAQEIWTRSDERHQRHHHFFADRIDRRIGDLREQLFEIGVQRLGAIRQHRERCVVAHRADGLLSCDRHRRHQELDVFLGVTKRLLAVEQCTVLRRRRCGDGWQIFQAYLGLVQPVAVRPRTGELRLKLGIVNDAPGLKIDQKHLARLQAPFLDDLVLRDIQYASL